MSNSDLILQLYQAFSKRDLAWLKKNCADDLIWQQNPGFPGGTTSHGISEIIENVYEGNSKRWNRFSFVLRNIFEGSNRVCVQGAYIIESHKTGNLVEVDTSHIFEIKNNLVISFQQYTDSKILWDHI